MKLIAVSLIAFFAFFSHNSKAHYAKAVKAELADYAQRYDAYKAHPPKHTTADQDELYLTRGQMDIAIADAALGQYMHGHAAKDDVEAALRQMERDQEDAPVLADLRDRI